MFDDSIVNAFVSLILVVGAMGLILFLLKKYIKKHKKARNNLNLEILSRTSLTPKNHLFVVKVEGKTLLLGATEHNITTLTELGAGGVTDNYDVIDNVNRKAPAPVGSLSARPQAKPRVAVPAADDDDSLSFSSFLKQTFRKQNN